MIRKWKSALLAVLFAAAAGRAANGQGYPDQNYPETSGDELPVQQTVARLSYVNGDVSFARGDDPDNWQPADPNVPITLGDRAWTADGRLELQIHGGNVVRLAKQTDLTALNLTEDTKQFSMSAGVASFRVRRLYEDEVFEVDTPNAAITFESPGDYRIDVRPDGDTRLQVHSGRAVVAAGGGQIPIDGGEAMLVDGDQPPRYDFIPMGFPDGWDGWVSEREARYRNVRSYQYVSHSISGVEDLDTYGSWQRIPSYGWCWTPASVTVGWAPYRAGRWLWQDPWGWTWVSTEPWGWAPYHYGRWVTYSSRWFWVPVAPAVAVVAYRPALVAFVGGGPGFGVSAGFSTDYVGWFPLAPREPFIPWWGAPAVNVNVTNVTYINRTYVTVVNQQTFVQSQVVTTNYVRDASVIQRIERAPVVRGTIPIVPTQASIRGSTRPAASVPRPPQQIAQRAVVTRVAPPPAPPRFDEKVQVIRQQRGAPVNAAQAQKLAVERGQSKAQVPVRPAAEAGRVQLAPRGDTARGKQPEPVAAPRGRELATAERPVAPQAPVSAAARGRQNAQPREVPEPQAPVRQAQPQREAPSREAPPAREVQREVPPQRTAPPAREVQREQQLPSERNVRRTTPAPPPEARAQRYTAQEPREGPPPRVTRPPHETAPEREARPESQSREQRQSYATPERALHPTPRLASEQPPPRQAAPPPSERSQPRNEPEARSQENRGHEKAEEKPTQKPNHDRSKPRPTPKPD